MDEWGQRGDGWVVGSPGYVTLPCNEGLLLACRYTVLFPGC